VIKYINDKTHNLRYVFKNRVTDEIYFVVVITLLFGEELEQALKEENERSINASRDASRDASVVEVPVDGEEGVDEVHSPVQEFHDAPEIHIIGATI
jgi:hypothetical protein